MIDVHKIHPTQRHVPRQAGHARDIGSRSLRRREAGRRGALEELLAVADGPDEQGREHSRDGGNALLVKLKPMGG